MYNPVKYTDPSGHGICDAEPGKPIPDFCLNPQFNPSDGVAPPVYSLHRGGGYDFSLNHLAYDYNDPPTDLRAASEGFVIVNDPCHIEDCENRNSWETNHGYGNVILIEYPASSLPAYVRENFPGPAFQNAEGDWTHLNMFLTDDMSIYILYAHLDQASHLNPGASVGPDQWIGTMGNTGASTGAHLHMEVFIGPRDYFQPTDELFDIKGKLNSRFWRTNPQWLERFYIFDPYYDID
jgi:hypothetical protein